jgi:uncharacterized repeat protein (TIGR03803 family)
VSQSKLTKRIKMKIEPKQFRAAPVWRLGIMLLVGIAWAFSMGQSTEFARETSRRGDSSQSPAFRVLHAFRDPKNGLDPSGLVEDLAGNLYGVTGAGGDLNCDLTGSWGCGIVYRLNPAGGETVLHRFDGSPTDEGGPMGRLVRDAQGNLYGTTIGSPLYCGTVFKIDNTAKKSVLHIFSCGADGGIPQAGLLRDSAGNLYGTTSAGGASGQGTVFRIDTSGKESVLYSFTGGSDGGTPQAALIRDSVGNLYGTTADGGNLINCNLTGSAGCGVVFKLDTSGLETVLHTFTGPDGIFPNTALIRDAAGNLYGTTANGGDLSCNLTGISGCGVVFKLDVSGNLKLLYVFKGGADGGIPSADLLQDSTGNLYGSTGLRGNSVDCGFPGSGCGVVFRLDTNGKETVLHTFSDGADGGVPDGLLLGADGNIYGTTAIGGGSHNVGVIFKISR